MNALFSTATSSVAATATAVEFDFLAVGEATKSGDSIVIRYGQVGGAHEIMVVDGGCLKAGDRLVEHLKALYGDHVVITHMVCTHSDGDHASGLRRVIEQVPVLNLWVHQPWSHAAALLPAFKYGGTEEGLAKHLRNDCFPIIADLCDLAEEYGVPLREPFAGLMIGPLRILAPTKARYLDLVPRMGQTPVEKALAQDSRLFETIKRALASIFGTPEDWGIETLKDPSADSTSIPNETSVVLFSQISGKRVLLTADAGVGALTEAIEVAAYLGLNIVSPDMFQAPHHGSRHNVGPTTLNAILGAKNGDGDTSRGWVIVSCAKDCEKKPYRSVTNAFRRRGFRTATTKGSLVNFRVGYSMRQGLAPVTDVPFYPLVED